MPLDIRFLPFALLVGLALPRLRDARLVAAGVLVASLAVASAALVLGDGTAGALAARVAERGVSPGYLTVNATLLLVAFGLAAAALAADRADRRPAATAALGLVLVACTAWAWPLVARGRLPVAIPAAIAVVLALLAVATWLGSGRRPAAVPPLDDWAHRGWRAGVLEWGIASAALAGILAPDFGVGLVLAGIALTLAWFAGPERRGLARVPLVPVAALLAFGVAALAWRAAGDDGLAYTGIADAPFSPRLQVLLLPALVPALFALAGVPPFDRLMPGAALAPFAGALAAHGVAPGLVDGVLHWRSALALWLVVGAADGLRRERPGPLLGCASLFLLLVGGEAGVPGGLVLALLASIAELVPRLARAVPSWLPRAVAATALAGWAHGLRAALAEEVVYSVAFVAVLVVGVLRVAGRPVETPAAPVR